MNKTILITGGIFGLLAVILGAFGAHSLKEILTPEKLESYKTGVDYQMYHAIVLLILGNLNAIPVTKKKKLFYLFSIGILLFSGSIYLLALSSILNIDINKFGFITPIGGSILIFGWFFLIFDLIKIKEL